MTAAAAPGGWRKGLLEDAGGGRGPQLATIAAAALAAGQAALLVFHLLPARQHAAPPPPPPAPALAANNLQALLASQPFGSPAPAAVDGADAPRTNVALVLTGTLAVRDPKQGLAIVGETAPGARVYAVGALLPGGVKLHEVYPDRVVLDRGGTLETLPLPRELTGATVASQSAARAGGAANPRPGHGTYR
jgi:general secretion pathway protein C